MNLNAWMGIIFKIGLALIIWALLFLLLVSERERGELERENKRIRYHLENIDLIHC